MDKREVLLVLVLILAVSAVVFADSYDKSMTGEAIGVFPEQLYTRGSISEPPVRQDLDMITKGDGGGYSFKDGDLVTSSFFCENVGNLRIETVNDKVTYAEITIGKGTGSCVLSFDNKKRDYIENTRVIYDVTKGYLAVVVPTAETRAKIKGFLSSLQYDSVCKPELKKIEVKPSKIKKSTLVVISAFFECRDSDVPVNARIYRNGELFDEIALYHEKEGRYSNTFFSNQRGRYSVEIIG